MVRRGLLYKVLCHVSSIGTKFMQSGVWQGALQLSELL
jgi:hypothetical protein